MHHALLSRQWFYLNVLMYECFACVRMFRSFTEVTLLMSAALQNKLLIIVYIDFIGVSSNIVQ